MGSRITGEMVALDIVNAWLHTPFEGVAIVGVWKKSNVWPPRPPPCNLKRTGRAGELGGKRRVMNVILDNLTLFCYILSTLFHWLLMAARKHTLLPYAVGAACVGFLVHTGYLSLEVSRIGSMLFSEVQGTTAFFSWTVVLVYLIAEAVTRIRALGSFLMPMALLALLLGLAIPPDAAHFLPPLTSFWLITHVVLALLGNAAFALTFCGGIMYLIQDSYLKAKQPGGFRPSCRHWKCSIA